MADDINPHEEAARARKVVRLVHALALAGITRETLSVLDDPQVRVMAERVAGVKPCSPATWQQVVDELKRLGPPATVTDIKIRRTRRSV